VLGAFAVLTLRAIGKIRRSEWTGPEAAAHFDQVVRNPWFARDRPL
jgi:hypothetical protein